MSIFCLKQNAIMNKNKMAYHIYTTEAFILGADERGEADRLLTIFTRDLGLVRVVAKGVRHAKSKLAPHLLNFSCSKVSMVRGKEVWRLTGAQPHSLSIKIKRGNVNSDASSGADLKTNTNTSSKSELFGAYARILNLVRRFIHFESADPKLFDCIKVCFEVAEKDSLLKSPEDLDIFEALLIMKIMHILGYVAGKESLNIFLSDDPITESMLVEAKKESRTIIQIVNNALKESQL